MAVLESTEHLEKLGKFIENPAFNAFLALGKDTQKFFAKLFPITVKAEPFPLTAYSELLETAPSDLVTFSNGYFDTSSQFATSSNLVATQVRFIAYLTKT